MNGLESFLLRDRLRSAGFAPSVFRYPSMRASLAEVTAALAERLRALEGTVHVVAHSLGGLLALETFETTRELPPGRVVLLGSPVQGSQSARAVAGWPVGPQLLGPLATAELTARRERVWRQDRELGVIAGSRSAGLGRMFTDLPQPNDGSVSQAETQLPGARDQLMLPVTHTGMLLSQAVASSIIAFLRNGRFDRRVGRRQRGE